MNKEIGHYYNLNAKSKITKIHSIDIETSDSYYVILQSSFIEDKSEIHIVHIKENDYQLQKNVIFMCDCIITEAKVFPMNGKFILFGIGYPSKSLIEKESFFFQNEINFLE